MSSPIVLITRAKKDSEELVDDVTRRGAKTLISPMLEIQFCEGKELNFSNIQGILFTSSNGVRALNSRLSNLQKISSIPVFAVGEATATAAKNIGFTSINIANGNVDSLAKKTSKILSPDKGELIHIAAHDLAGNLAGKLKNRGFCVKTEKLYRANQVTEIDKQTLGALRRGLVKFVLFFSPRTTRTLVKLIKDNNYTNSLVNIEAICLSDAVAIEANSLRWQKVLVSQEPTKAKLLHYLDKRIAILRDG